MSLRQAARLRRARGMDDADLRALVEEKDDDEEESSEEEAPEHSFTSSLALARVAMGSWSSDSSSGDENKYEREEEDEEEYTPTEQPCTEDTSKLTSHRKRKEKRGRRSKVNVMKKNDTFREENDDDEILDCIIAELKQNTEAKVAAEGDELPTVINPIPCLRTDSKFLNVDSELRSRFGRGILRAGVDESAHERGRLWWGGVNRHRGQSQRRCLRHTLIGKPESGWPRPPGFTGGGLGVEPMASPQNAAAHSSVNEGAKWFIFRHSAAYDKLCEKFEIIQQSMDPNLLAVFVSSSPHHAEALLELALVCAHSKLMDKAGRLVRRCIYAFEAHISESFRSAVLAAQARLDASVPSNYTYIRSLFEHMRLCDMRGCHRTACEVARLLLSLDPLNDPMGVLLYVDSFALKAGAFEIAVQLSASSGLSELNLPGIAFSCCLSHARLGNETEALTSMKLALSRFPFVLKPLLDAMGIPSPQKVTSPYDWRSIFSSVPFSQYKAPPLASHLAKIYAICAGDVWSSDIAKGLLYDGASLVTQMGCHAASIADGVLTQSYENENSPLKRYLRYQIKDFRIPYPEFPEQVIDAGIIDESEHGPIRLIGGIDPIDAAQELLLQQRGHHVTGIFGGGGGARWVNQNRPREVTQEGTVMDLNLPLAELFWRSFLPWSRLPPP